MGVVGLGNLCCSWTWRELGAWGVWRPARTWWGGNHGGLSTCGDQLTGGEHDGLIKPDVKPDVEVIEEAQGEPGSVDRGERHGQTRTRKRTSPQEGGGRTREHRGDLKYPGKSAR